MFKAIINFNYSTFIFAPNDIGNFLIVKIAN